MRILSDADLLPYLYNSRQFVSSGDVPHRLAFSTRYNLSIEFLGMPFQESSLFVGNASKIRLEASALNLRMRRTTILAHLTFECDLVRCNRVDLKHVGESHTINLKVPRRHLLEIELTEVLSSDCSCEDSSRGVRGQDPDCPINLLLKYSF